MTLIFKAEHNRIQQGIAKSAEREATSAASTKQETNPATEAKQVGGNERYELPLRVHFFCISP